MVFLLGASSFKDVTALPTSFSSHPLPILCRVSVCVGLETGRNAQTPKQFQSRPTPDIPHNTAPHRPRLMLAMQIINLLYSFQTIFQIC